MALKACHGKKKQLTQYTGLLRTLEGFLDFVSDVKIPPEHIEAVVAELATSQAFATEQGMPTVASKLGEAITAIKPHAEEPE